MRPGVEHSNGCAFSDLKRDKCNGATYLFSNAGLSH